MADFAKMVEHVARAEKEVTSAMECLHPAARITLTDSYVLGHLRACQAVLDSVRKCIRDHQAKIKAREGTTDETST